MVFLSPLLAYGNAMHTEFQESVKDCCSMDSSEQEDAHSCCTLDLEETSKTCDENPCHPSSCHINQVNVLPAYVPENLEELNPNFKNSEKLKIDNYKSLLISDVSSSSWKPPRFNS